MKSEAFKTPIDKELYVGELGVDCGHDPDSEAKAFEIAGWAKITSAKPRTHVELTEEGKTVLGKVDAKSWKSNLFGCNYEVWHFPIATPDSITVTGVTQSQNFREAEFYIHYKVNEVGQLWSDNHFKAQIDAGQIYLFPHFYSGGETSDKHVARFKLYDDGWRLED